MKCFKLSQKKQLLLIAVVLYLFLLALNVLSPFAADDYSYMYQFAGESGERISKVFLRI